MIDIVPPRPARRRPAALGPVAAIVCLALAAPAAAAPALPDWDAAKKGDSGDKGAGGKKDDKKPSQLPDWDAATKKDGGKKDGGQKKDPPATGDGKKTAPLPDWDAAKKTDGGKGTKPPKKKTPKPEEAPPDETPPDEAPADTVVGPEAPPAEPPTPEEAPPAEPPPAEVTTTTPPIEGPTPAPGVDLGRDDTGAALRQAKRMLISGGVITLGGLAGVGVMAAGFVSEDEARGDNLIAAGAVTGVIGLTMGLALVGEGVRELKAARKRQSARVDVTPTLGGLVVRGRF